MRDTILIHATINMGGGIYSVIKNLVEYQNDKYGKVYIAVPQEYITKGLTEEFPKNEILPLYESCKNVKYLIRGTNLKKLKDKIQKENPNKKVVLICHAVGAIGLFGRLPNYSICILHGHIFHDNKTYVKVFYKLLFWKLKVKKTKLVTVSQETQKYFKEYLNVDSTVIVNGVSNKGKKIDNKIFNIGFAGIINNHKGWAYVVEAGKFLLDSGNNNFKITIAGEEQEKGEVTKEIEKYKLSGRVNYLGQINDFANTILKTYDIIILPSVMEGLPMCLLEAQAYGIPILSTNVGGISEILQDGVNGYFIKRDAKNITEKILKCMDKVNYDFLSKNSLDIYKNKFTVEKMGNQYTQLIES